MVKRLSRSGRRGEEESRVKRNKVETREPNKKPNNCFFCEKTNNYLSEAHDFHAPTASSPQSRSTCAQKHSAAAQQ